MSLDIIQVAEELGLRKAGTKNGEHNYFDPADNDTPDLWINARKNQWYTYAGGQNKGGGYVDLVAHVKKTTKDEAKDWLIDNFAEEYSDKDTEQINREEKAKQVLSKAEELAQDTLHKRKKALKEKIKSNRDFEEEDIQEKGIGFLSSDDSNVLQKRFDKQELIDSGLFQESDNELYCHLENRIIFPYYNDEKPVFMAGRKHPDSDSNAKYKKTYNTDYNRHILYQFRENTEELIITEGFTDTISAHKSGYDVVTPATTQFKKEDIQKISKIAEKYEKVYIVNDGDEAGEKGALKTSKNLIQNGTNPFIVKLEEGKDLDDWTTENNYTNLEELLSDSKTFLDYLVEEYGQSDIVEQKERKKKLFRLLKDWEPSERKQIWDKLEETTTQLEYEFQKWKKNSKTENYDPYEYWDEDEEEFNQVYLAQDIALDYDFTTIRDSDQFLIYKNGYWQDRAKTFVREEVTERMGKHWDKGIKKQAVEWIRDSNYRERSDFQPDERKLNLKNGVYDLQENRLVPHSPAYKFPFKVPWEYKENAECPKIDEFLDEITNNNKERKKKLYQLAAYTLLPDMPYAKAGMLAGPGGNGKTVFIELLKNLLGKNSNTYTNKTLHDLEKSFDMHELYGTLASFDDDIGSAKIPNKATERFKKLTGGTDQGAEIKYGHQYDFKPYSTFIFAANHIPPTSDESRGFFRRWVIVHLPVNFVENPNPKDELEKEKKDKNDLLDELTSKQEMEGFLRRCVQELEEILGNNGFTCERSLEDKRKKWREHSTPIVSFIEKFLQQGVTKAEEERKKKSKDSPDWNTWTYDYIREDCLLDLITAYSKTRLGQEVKKSDVRDALDDSDLFCNAGTQIRREPASLSTSNGTTRVVSGIKMDIPKDRSNSKFPEYVCNIVERKYKDSNQSIQEVKMVDQNVSGQIKKFMKQNHNSSAIGREDLIDTVLSWDSVGDSRSSDWVDDKIGDLLSDATLYEPRSGKVQFLGGS